MGYCYHKQFVKETKSIHVLLLGYTYKKDSKDIRESPALHIEKFLLEKNLVVFKYDPLIDNLSKEEVNKLNNTYNPFIIFLLKSFNPVALDPLIIR